MASLDAPPLDGRGKYPHSARMEQFISEIQSYCERTGMSASAFGMASMNDHKFVGRLKAGGQCLPSTMQRVRAFMESNPQLEDSGSP